MAKPGGRRKMTLGIRGVWIFFGRTLLLFALLELALSIAFYFRDRALTGNGDHRAGADTYKHSDWPHRYYEEHREVDNVEWHPYVYWRRKPYEGQYINVNELGIRKSWTASPQTDAKKYRPLIYFFGGSTTWGTGSRDDYTIPSAFAKQMADLGIGVRVVNRGETGYVSTQEVLLLIRELQRGIAPDLVIFYNGVNDTYSAYQQGVAGMAQQEYNRVKEFNSRLEKVPAKEILSSLSQRLSTSRFARGIWRRTIGGGNVTTRERVPSSFRTSSQEPLAARVLDIYESNIAIVSALAQYHYFKVLFCWQPTIFEKNNLTEYEAQEKQKQADLEPFFDRVYQMQRERDLPTDDRTAALDLSRLFSEKSEPLYIDFCHLGETGDAYVAEELVKEAVKLIKID